MATRTRRAWSGAMALLIAVGVPGAVMATDATALAANSCSVTNAATSAHFTNLQAAITAAEPGRTLHISGTCVGHFSVDKALTLRKGSGSAILKGNGSTVLTVTGAVTLIGLRITGGRASACPSYVGWVCGGGIANLGDLAVVDSTISGNKAVGGKANSSLGGGIYNDPTGSLTLSRSTVSGNTASSKLFEADGAGIDNEGELHLVRSTVSGNHSISTVHGYGGGIFAYGTNHLSVSESTISGNIVTAPSNAQGGGIFISSGTVSVYNSTISGNSVTGGGDNGIGGGIYDSGADLTIVASTIAGNHVGAPHGGGGGLYSEGTPFVESTIIAGNTGKQARDCVFLTEGASQGYNIIGSGAGCNGFQNGINHDKVGTNASPLNAKLAPLANNGGPTKTRALKPGSPAINGGPHTTMCYTTKDQRGIHRPQHNRCDIGAFEKT